jgi:hypothetical protein
MGKSFQVSDFFGSLLFRPWPLFHALSYEQKDEEKNGRYEINTTGDAITKQIAMTVIVIE